MSCRCKSYNKPELGGDLPEVILAAPAWSAKPNGICVDACIAEAIKMLWEVGIVTRGCCCGHNRERPSVIVDESMAEEHIQLAQRMLQMHDGRHWRVMQWRLVTLGIAERF